MKDALIMENQYRARVDPFTTATLAATVVPLVSGAAGEAGKQAWASLVTFVKTRFGRESAPAVAAAEVSRQPQDTAAVQRLAEALTALAREHDDVDDWLCGWQRQAVPLTVNIVGGQATVHGSVIQAQNITGSINL